LEEVFIKPIFPNSYKAMKILISLLLATLGKVAGEPAEPIDLTALMASARDLPISEPRTLPSPAYKTNITATRRTITDEELAFYNEEGYIILRNFFSKEEMDMMRGCVEEDPLVSGKVVKRQDLDGKTTKLTLWTHFGDDSFGQIGRSASMVSAASKLMGGAEPYSSHTKILLKEPFKGGAWEWHQDFGYWYNHGLTHPDKIISAIVAIDENREDNGAMRVITKSHKLGKLDHGDYAGQTGANPVRVLKAISLPGYDNVNLLLSPGDVCFTHSNLLHASRPNLSADWRRNFIVAYNSKENQPIQSIDHSHVQPLYNAIDVVTDEALMEKGCQKLSTDNRGFMDPSQKNYKTPAEERAAREAKKAEL